MITTKRFPDFDIRQGSSMENVSIELNCHVRVKRQGKWWRVSVSNQYRYQNYADQFQQFAQDLRRFQAHCKMTELFWTVPTDPIKIEEYKERDIMIECQSHLSNKEEDLMRYGPT